MFHIFSKTEFSRSFNTTIVLTSNVTSINYVNVLVSYKKKNILFKIYQEFYESTINRTREKYKRPGFEPGHSI